MRRAAVFLLLILSIQLVFGQHPNLNRPQTYGNDLLSSAHHQYNRSNYDSSNALFLKALESQEFQALDFLCFANGLMHRSKSSLAREFFQEYLRLSGNEYGPIADMVSAIYRKDTMRVPLSRVLSSTENWYGLIHHKASIYGSKQGHILGLDFACGSTGDERLMLAAGPSLKHYGISFFNDGFSAVIAMGVSGDNSQLYVIHRSSEGWSDPKVIKFKKTEASYITPYFDEENSILYFASNASGGHGGYDLYLSYLVKGKFQEAINLGSNLNTAKDEISPNIRGEWLRFSSNGYPTKGGFDLYRYKVIDDFNYVLFNERRLNTAEDELAIAVLQNDSYLVNRYSDGLSYVVELSTPQPLTNYSGLVLDERKRPLSAAIALIGDHTQGQYVKVRNGNISFQLPKTNEAAYITVMAEGFEDQKLSLEAGVSFVVNMKALKSLEIVKVIDQRSPRDSLETIYSLEQDESDSVAHRKPSLKEGVLAPEQGQFYVIVGSARNYEDAYRSWSRWNKELDQLHIYQFNAQLFRIGFEAGSNELEALNHLRNTLKVQSDAWIIRPGTL